jgi:hypothetical protein
MDTSRASILVFGTVNDSTNKQAFNSNTKTPFIDYAKGECRSLEERR